MIVTYFSSHPSIAPVIRRPSVDTVGDVPSHFLYPSKVLCLLPSATFLPLMSPFLFSVREESYDKASAYSSLVSSSGFIGV